MLRRAVSRWLFNLIPYRQKLILMLFSFAEGEGQIHGYIDC